MLDKHTFPLASDLGKFEAKTKAKKASKIPALPVIMNAEMYSRI